MTIIRISAGARPIVVFLLRSCLHDTTKRPSHERPGRVRSVLGLTVDKLVRNQVEPSVQQLQEAIETPQAARFDPSSPQSGFLTKR